MIECLRFEWVSWFGDRLLQRLTGAGLRPRSYHDPNFVRSGIISCFIRYSRFSDRVDHSFSQAQSDFSGVWIEDSAWLFSVSVVILAVCGLVGEGG